MGVRIKGISIENNLYCRFLEYLNRNNIKELFLSTEEFKGLLRDFKQQEKEY